MTQSDDRDLVSVAIVRDVKPERIDEFESWLDVINDAVSAFDGYAGMDVLRPSLSSTSIARYTAILRFMNHEKYAVWYDSSQRAKLLAHAADLSLSKPILEETHGLESWFTAPDLNAVVPSKHKMALLTFAALYPLIMATGAVFGLVPVDAPAAVSTLITVGVVAPAATYFVMPQVTRLFRRWLFPGGGDAVAASS